MIITNSAYSGCSIFYKFYFYREKNHSSLTIYLLVTVPIFHHLPKEKCTFIFNLLYINTSQFFKTYTLLPCHSNTYSLIFQGQKTTVPVKLRQTSPDVWHCEYVSPIIGLHSVNIFFAGKLIPNNPIGVRVAPVSDAKKCKAFGRGLLSNGVRVKDDADFTITTTGAGEGVADVRIIAPGGINLPAKYVSMFD